MRRRRLTLMFSLVLAGAPLLSAAETPQQVPAGGQALLAPNALVSSTGKSFFGDQYGSAEVVAVEGMPFAKALRVKTSSMPLKRYYIGSKFADLPALKAGDAVLVSLYIRCLAGGDVNTGAGQVGIVVQTRGDNKNIAKYDAMPGGDWQRYLVPVPLAADVAAGDLAVSLSYGAMLQTVELGGLEVLNYGRKIAEKDLPVTTITYVGREQDAAWRKAALERIEQIRKADLTVTVKDANGQPLRDAQVEVKMLRHAFQFGAAITSRAFTEDSAETKPLLEVHKKLFNGGLPVAFFRWPAQETAQGKKGAELTLSYLRENHMASRGHVLLWERDDQYPDDVRQMIQNKDADKLRQRIIGYLTEVVNRYKGRIDEWVVENEAVDNSEFRKVLGEASIAEWYKVVHQLDPKAKLMLNENRVEGLKPDKSDRMLHLAKVITDNGAPLDVLGIQGHFAASPVPPEALLKHYDKLAASGKTLAITEYDFDTTDETLKADFTRDILIAVFSHPSFNCFTIFRYWDGKPTKHESVVYANDWTLRPSGKVYEDLVLKQWWTKVAGKTDAAGQLATRGFLGDYEITVTANGRTQTVKTAIKAGQPNVLEVKF